MSEKRRYMKIEDVKFKQPLSGVKRAKLKNDTLIVPENFIDEITRVLIANNIKYTTIEDPALYPKEELDAGIQRYEDLEPGAFSGEKPVLLITEFDADALFEWTKQMLEETIDPSYAQFLEDESAEADEYYRTQYEYRPD